MKYAHNTHIGRRAHNEDQLYVPTQDASLPLVAVSDGMGGHAAGAVASKLIIDEMADEFRSIRGDDVVSQMRRAITRVNLDVYRAAQDVPELRGMGATLVCAALTDTHFIAANVGDSRLYHFDGSALCRVTVDHSYVQMLVDEGTITPEEARTHPQRNLITRAMGIGLRTDIDIFDRTWKDGDLLLLCSDGLHGSVEDSEIAEILMRAIPLSEMCDLLVALALNHGGSDNITVVLARNEGGTCA